MPIIITPITVQVSQPADLQVNCVWIEEQHVNAQKPQLGNTPSASVKLRNYFQDQSILDENGQPNGPKTFVPDDQIEDLGTADLFTAAKNMAAAGYTGMGIAVQAWQDGVKQWRQYKADRAAEIPTAQAAVATAQTALDTASAALSTAGSGLMEAIAALGTAKAANPPDAGAIATAQAAVDAINAAIADKQPAVTSAQTALIAAKANLLVATKAWQDAANPRLVI